jgi:hypothetical protein
VLCCFCCFLSCFHSCTRNLHLTNYCVVWVHDFEVWCRTWVTYNLLPMLRCNISFNKIRKILRWRLTLSLRLFRRKSPPAITPFESPMILTGTSIVISLSQRFERSICKISSVTGWTWMSLE